MLSSLFSRSRGKRLQSIKLISKNLYLFGTQNELSSSNLMNNNLSNLLLTLKENLNRYGKYHRSCAELHNNIAYILNRGGNYSEGLENYQQCLEISEKLYGYEHPSVANCLNQIASTELSLGKIPEAINYYKKALGIYEKLNKASEQANCHSSLAYIYKEMGDQDSAIKHSERALSLAIEGYKHKRDVVSVFYSNHGDTLEKFGQVEGALSYYEKAYEFTSKNPATIISQVILLRKLGELHLFIGDSQKALKYIEDCWTKVNSLPPTKIRELPPEFKNRTQFMLALAHEQTNNIEAALGLLEQLQSSLEEFNQVIPILIEVYYETSRIKINTSKETQDIVKDINKGINLAESVYGRGNQYTARFKRLLTKLEKKKKA